MGSMTDPSGLGPEPVPGRRCPSRHPTNRQTGSRLFRRCELPCALLLALLSRLLLLLVARARPLVESSPYRSNAPAAPSPDAPSHPRLNAHPRALHGLLVLSPISFSHLAPASSTSITRSPPSSPRLARQTLLYSPYPTPPARCAPGSC